MHDPSTPIDPLTSFTAHAVLPALSGLPVAPLPHQFGSESTNLEYTFLSSIAASFPSLTPSAAQFLADMDVLQTPQDLWGSQNFSPTAGGTSAVVSPTAAAAAVGGGSGGGGRSWVGGQWGNLKGADVYTSVSEPYDYREGFHYL
ncbi:hypothetical protein HK096_007566, partial [Nowakowskiella sp. JEL0078]